LTNQAIMAIMDLRPSRSFRSATRAL